VAELHRLHDALAHERRAEAGAESEEEHLAALVAPEGLHSRVIHDLRRHAERRFEIEAGPTLAEIDRVGDNTAAVDG
jgi:hypothetical protein